MDKSADNRIRYPLLDEIRGFAVVCMVFYHAFYLLDDLFGLAAAGKLLNFFMPVEPLFAALFVFISGMCTVFSRRPFRRGLLIAAVAALISITTFVLTRLGISCLIVFGILHMLAVCWLVFAAIRKPLRSINPVAGLCVCLLIFLITYHLESRYLGFGRLSLALPETLYQNNLFCFLGFTAPNFYSADYFPLLPWLFMFFFGVFASRLFPDGKLPGFFAKSRCRMLAFAGKNALWIYVLHQPVIFALAFLAIQVF